MTLSPFDDSLIEGLGREVPWRGAVGDANGGGIEDGGKLFENMVGGADASYFSTVEECYTVALAHFVEIGGRCHDGDSSLLQQGEHFP